MIAEAIADVHESSEPLDNKSVRSGRKLIADCRANTPPTEGNEGVSNNLQTRFYTGLCNQQSGVSCLQLISCKGFPNGSCHSAIISNRQQSHPNIEARGRVQMEGWSRTSASTVLPRACVIPQSTHTLGPGSFDPQATPDSETGYCHQGKEGAAG